MTGYLFGTVWKVYNFYLGCHFGNTTPCQDCCRRRKRRDLAVAYIVSRAGCGTQGGGISGDFIILGSTCIDSAMLLTRISKRDELEINHSESRYQKSDTHEHRGRLIISLTQGARASFFKFCPRDPFRSLNQPALLSKGNRSLYTTNHTNRLLSSTLSHQYAPCASAVYPTDWSCCNSTSSIQKAAVNSRTRKKRAIE
jgi:hypothetical protein